MLTPSLMLAGAIWGLTSTAAGQVELRAEEAAGRLAVLVDNREAVVYQYAASEPLPHYWPIRSPSGQLLTIQQVEPFPHHRSLWIADRVQAEGGPVVDFYHWTKNLPADGSPREAPRHQIWHRQFGQLSSGQGAALVEAQLQWLVDGKTPVLNEHRVLRVRALGDGQYLLDMAWELSPAKANVRFLSDAVHYAWPYVRMHPRFSAEQGGQIVSDTGGRGQQQTDGAAARWVDYSHTVDGVTEGLAVLADPDGAPHQWLTRDYGTFGPRRPDKLSGTRFTLAAGQTLRGRAGILVHRGDARSGHVAEHYAAFVGDPP